MDADTLYAALMMSFPGGISGGISNTDNPIGPFSSKETDEKPKEVSVKYQPKIDINSVIKLIQKHKQQNQSKLGLF